MFREPIDYVAEREGREWALRDRSREEAAFDAEEAREFMPPRSSTEDKRWEGMEQDSVYVYWAEEA